MAVLTLLSRAYCHLCDDMRDALLPLAKRHGVTVVEIDVDAVPALETRFGERVPVLLLGDAATGCELCHYRLDADMVVAALARTRSIG
ncbi:MAG: glutaredoxin family protein [Burkholderiales bacterium]|nr:glutaredoxin family protein [Burkholderiales bacterium]